MFNLDNVTTKNDNKSWLYRFLLIGPSGSGLIQQDNNIIDKIYLHAKDLEKPKYQYLIKKKRRCRNKKFK